MFRREKLVRIDQKVRISEEYGSLIFSLQQEGTASAFYLMIRNRNIDTG